MTSWLRWGWLPAGLAVAVAVAAAFGSQRAWVLILSYTALNALGVALMTHADRTSPTDTPEGVALWGKIVAIARVGFVLQLPVGIFAVMLEGL